MKVFLLPSPGRLPHVSLLPIPSPGHGMLQIRIKATALGHADPHFLQHSPTLQYPLIMGCDLAGIVTALGPGVHDWKIGDKVFAFLNPSVGGQGTFAEYCTIDQDLCAHKPSSVSFDEAATLSSPLLSAASALFYDMALPEPSGAKPHPDHRDTILIYGLTGPAAAYAIQLASLAALTVVVACPRELSSYAQSLGARYTIDIDAPDLLHLAQEYLVPPNTLHVLDTTSLDYTSADPSLPPLPKASTHAPITHRLHQRHDHDEDPSLRPFIANLLPRVSQWVAEESILPSNVQRLPNGLNSIPYGLRQIAIGQDITKTYVINPEETT